MTTSCTVSAAVAPRPVFRHLPSLRVAAANASWAALRPGRTDIPASTIERIVNEGGYDVVVVGSRGLGPLSRFLEGSVSEHVATHAEATVIIAR